MALTRVREQADGNSAARAGGEPGFFVRRLKKWKRKLRERRASRERSKKRLAKRLLSRGRELWELETLEKFELSAWSQGGQCNMDELEDHELPDGPCPWCGSVWVGFDPVLLANVFTCLNGHATEEKTFPWAWPEERRT